MTRCNQCRPGAQDAPQVQRKTTRAFATAFDLAQALGVSARLACLGNGCFMDQIDTRSPNPRRRAQWACALALLALLSACSSLLPRASSATSDFRHFEDLRDTVQNLQPMQTRLAELERLGIDPAKLPNTRILTYVDILQRFVPGPAVRREDLDAGILACIEARDGCRGWELDVAFIKRDRTGNFLADFLNFKRRTETTGWRFTGLILLAHGTVVYRVWGGQPLVNQLEVQTNPLGPLQDIGPAVVTHP